MVTGSGSKVGNYLCENEKVNVVSLTGSTEVGIDVAKTCAKTLKTVEQGGKIVLGGNRKGSFVEPTVIMDVPFDADIIHDIEVFNLNKNDLIITCKYIFEPYFGDLDIPAQVIYQETFGQGEPNDDIVNILKYLLCRFYLILGL